MVKFWETLIKTPFLKKFFELFISNFLIIVSILSHIEKDRGSGNTFKAYSHLDIYQGEKINLLEGGRGNFNSKYQI